MLRPTLHWFPPFDFPLRALFLSQAPGAFAPVVGTALEDTLRSTRSFFPLNSPAGKGRSSEGYTHERVPTKHRALIRINSRSRVRSVRLSISSSCFSIGDLCVPAAFSAMSPLIFPLPWALLPIGSSKAKETDPVPFPSLSFPSELWSPGVEYSGHIPDSQMCALPIKAPFFDLMLPRWGISLLSVCYS